MTREPIKSPVVLHLKHPTKECSTPSDKPVKWVANRNGRRVWDGEAFVWYAARETAITKLGCERSEIDVKKAEP
jgi:hypothetical protein